jgi:hypothetical protein
MKKLFTFISALLSMFAVLQTSTAADLVFNVTVPEGTRECWVIGNFVGPKWPIEKAYQMTRSATDTLHYTVTVPESEIEPGLTQIEYKYLSGPGDWAYVEKKADGGELDGNRVYDPANPGREDVVAKWAAIYIPHPITPARVSITALVPASVQVLYITGNFNGWAVPTDSTEMSFLGTTEDGKIFVIENLYTPDIYALQFKFVAGPGWVYEQTESASFVWNDPNEREQSAICESFKKIYDPTQVGNVTIIATVPAGTERVWIMGSHLGWNWANLKEGTRNEDGTFTIVAENVMSFEYRLYNWFEPEWGYPEVGEADPNTELPNRQAQYDPNNPENNTIHITVWGWKQPAPSAVANIFFDRYQVKTVNRTITVNNVTSGVELFDVMGRQIEKANFRGTYTTKTLTNGIYILKVDGITAKIAVK